MVPKSARPEPTIDAPVLAIMVAVVVPKFTLTGTHPSTVQRSWKSRLPPPNTSLEPAFISANVNGGVFGSSPKLPMPVTGTIIESSLNCVPKLLVVVMRTVTCAAWPAATSYGAGTSAWAHAVTVAAIAKASCAQRWLINTNRFLGGRVVG